MIGLTPRRLIRVCVGSVTLVYSFAVLSFCHSFFCRFGFRILHSSKDGPEQNLEAESLVPPT